MKQHTNLRALALMFLAPAAAAFEGEVYCVQGAEVAERWAVPAGGLPWRFHGGPGGVANGPVIQFNPIRVGPEFYPLSASSGLPPEQRPGLQSMMRATAAWANASIGGQSVTDLTFAPPVGITQLPNNPGIQLTSLLFQANGARILDGSNLITLWEPSTTFSLFGGPGVVGVAVVDIPSLATGLIGEADVALNARTTVDGSPDGRPYWSFVEYNDAAARWFGSTTFNVDTTTDIAPASGFVDLEGVLVHELGHFLGLTHSMVDGYWAPAIGSSPSMFITGHTSSPLAGQLSFYDGPGQYVDRTMAGSSTPVGGLLTASAKSLEQDDKVAIAKLYPKSTAVTGLGRIAGQVRTPSGSGLAGAHVVAIKTDEADVVRVGTFTSLSGHYSFDLLPPGTYHVFVEPADFGSTGLFEEGDYSYFTGSTACVQNAPQFTAEFYDAADVADEVVPMTVTTLTVGASQVLGGIDVIVDGVPQPRLRVELLNAAGPGSPRGLQVAPAPQATPMVSFNFDFGTQDMDRPAWLILSSVRGHAIIDGQVVVPSTVPGAHTLIPVTIPAGQSGSVVLPVNDGLAHRTMFAQAAVFSFETLTLRFSNPVAVYVERP